jgi:hypothetical protein
MEAVDCATSNSNELPHPELGFQHQSQTAIMKALSMLYLIAASSCALADDWVPIHGCEWVPGSTPVTNFTLFNSAINNTTPSTVHWQIPIHRVDCTVSNSSSIPPTNSPSVVPCTAPSSETTYGQFRVFEDNGSEKNAALISVAYQGCAAHIYAFYYRADFVVKCERDVDGNEMCVPKGNATAKVYSNFPLMPISPPPPKPWWQ